MVNTWNPSDKSPNMTLSNGNLTATCTSNSDNALRGTLSHTSGDGKFYLEFYNISGCDPGSFICGLAQSSFPLNTLNTSTDAGQANLIAQTANFGNVEGGFSFSNGYSTTNDGTVRCFAIDFIAGKVWYREGNKGWLTTANSMASQNPSTPVGGTGFTKTHVYFPVFATKQSGGTCTINTGNTGFILPVPTGYVGWDGSPPTPTAGPQPVIILH